MRLATFLASLRAASKRVLYGKDPVATATSSVPVDTARRRSRL